MTEKKESAKNNQELVVIGSSAGGIEALSVLVKTLPANFPAPVVLAQHLDPTHASNLDTILQRHSSLPVVIIENKAALEPGKIYVVPANKHVAISDHTVEVRSDHIQRPKPSVDLLLSSAAKVFGERLIAIILTGSGKDGAAGSVDVKNAGGTVIIQNPNTARYPSMPMALPPTVVDFIVDLEQIGPLVYNLLTGTEFPPSHETSADALREIFELVSRKVNINFQSYKTTTILRRISRRMVLTHNHTIREYTEYLRKNPEEINELATAFLIKVTHFFRDTEAFDYLRKDILPKLIERGRTRNNLLRFWSAGCATGEEPFSLAMIIADMLGSELPQWNIKIFATDLDGMAVNFARRGIYCDTVIKDVPDEYRERFFEQTDSMHRVSKVLRQMVIFGQQDLSWSAPFPRIDLVTCRNLLIYFTPDLQQRVLDLFSYSLRQGGYLFLGKAETTGPAKSTFDLVNKKWKIYQSRTIDYLSPIQRQEMYNWKLNSQGRQILPAKLTPKAVPGQEMIPVEAGQMRRLNEYLLRYLPLGVALIDNSYHLLMINAPARRLLNLHETTKDQDFLHAIRGIPYAQIRNAIDTAFHEHEVVILSEVELEVSLGGDGRYLNFMIVPIPGDGDMVELAIITVTDVTDQVRIRRKLEVTQAEQNKLLNEVNSTNKRLNEANRELIDANERLQAANEELMLAHEELQATNEEFETTNEELQSTNEELETNNEELQATNEELEATNNELSIRTAELQELATSLSNERMRLGTMIEMAPFHIMVVKGPQLIIEAFSPSFASLFAEQKPLGKPLYQIKWKTDMTRLIDLALEAYENNTPKINEEANINLSGVDGGTANSFFVFTIVPTQDSTGQVDGVVVYASDMTEQKVKTIEEERERLKLIIENCNHVALALFDANTTQLLQASALYLDMLVRAYGYEREEIIGRRWEDLCLPATREEGIEFLNKVMESSKPLRWPDFRNNMEGELKNTRWNWGLTPVSGGIKENINYLVYWAVDITKTDDLKN
jgi:two-component system, chemotaxis family, CheB/CheR fusion protein